MTTATYDAVQTALMNGNTNTEEVALVGTTKDGKTATWSVGIAGNFGPDSVKAMASNAFKTAAAQYSAEDLAKSGVQAFVSALRDEVGNRAPSEDATIDFRRRGAPVVQPK